MIKTAVINNRREDGSGNLKGPPPPLPPLSHRPQESHRWTSAGFPGTQEQVPPATTEMVTYRHCHSAWTFTLSQRSLPAEDSVPPSRPPQKRFHIFMCVRYPGLNKEGPGISPSMSRTIEGQCLLSRSLVPQREALEGTQEA